MNYQQQARESFPDLMALHDAHQAALAEMKRRRDVPTIDRNVVMNEARMALLTGQPVDPDLGAVLASADWRRAEAEAHLGALGKLAEEFKGEAARFERDNADAMISTLTYHLPRILDTAGEVITRLRGARSAEAAINLGADAVQAWTDLGNVAADLGELYRAQFTMVQLGWDRLDSVTEFRGEMGVHLVIRDVETIWDRGTSANPPWPHHSGQPTHLPKLGREFLMWAVDNRDHVWLPTVSEAVEEVWRYLDATKPETVYIDPNAAAMNASRRGVQAAQASTGVLGLPIY